MTHETAKHLNKLLVDAAEVRFTHAKGLRAHLDVEGYTGYTKPSSFRQLVKLVLEAINSHVPEAQAAEIRDAARDRRRANLTPNDGGRITELFLYGEEDPNRVQPRAICLAEAEIHAIVAADNARRLKEYENYRQYCEQGVALPPTPDPTPAPEK